MSLAREQREIAGAHVGREGRTDPHEETSAFENHGAVEQDVHLECARQQRARQRESPRPGVRLARPPRGFVDRGRGRSGCTAMREGARDQEREIALGDTPVQAIHLGSKADRTPSCREETMEGEPSLASRQIVRTRRFDSFAPRGEIAQPEETPRQLQALARAVNGTEG